MKWGAVARGNAQDSYNAKMGSGRRLPGAQGCGSHPAACRCLPRHITSAYVR